MTFEEFNEAIRARSAHPQGFNMVVDDWTISDWFVSIMGELGEAANVVKKLNRSRTGARGNREGDDVLREKLRKELGDTYVTLVLLAQAVDVDLHAAAVEVFNAKSAEIGYPVVLKA